MSRYMSTLEVKKTPKEALIGTIINLVFLVIRNELEILFNRK